MKRGIILAATLLMAFSVIDCKPEPIDEKTGTLVLRKWFKQAAAISDDCKQQLAESRQAALAKVNVTAEQFDEWKNADVNKFKEIKKRVKGKFCNKKQAEGDAAGAKKKK